MKRMRIACCVPLGLVAFAPSSGCTTPGGDRTIRYVGSSTIGQFMSDARTTYGRCRFHIWVEPESYGGEQAVLKGIADIGGVARRLDPSVAGDGVVGTLIGKDAIAVIVNDANPITGLSTAQLRDVFAGKVKNWNELGGDDLPIKPLIVSRASATRNIFRAAVLGEQSYSGCEVIEPDRRMIPVVAATAGAIGHISFAFLSSSKGVKPLAIDGQEPSVRNPDYPITRPLHLCTLGPPRGEVKRFIDWTLSEQGQTLVRRRFVGVSSGE